MRRILHITLTSMALLIWGCTSDKVVLIELPVYEVQPVVECYLEPGKPFRLALFESVSYFEEPSLPVIENALVVVTHNGIADTLAYNLLGFEGDKYWNYWSTATVPYDYTSEFELYIRDPAGREVTASTRILEPVPFDTLEYEFNADSMALVRAKWPDDPSGPNYYRFTLHENNMLGEDNYQFAFELDDRIGNGEQFVVSSLYYREKGDTAIMSLYHITEEYWRFIVTADESADANGNPFAQPGSVKSNVQGGIGIFTGLSYVRDSLLIQ